MNEPATPTVPPDDSAPLPEDSGMKLLLTFIGLALCAHLLFAFGGGKYFVPWFLALFEQPEVKKKPEPKKEVVEVEMVEAVVAQPPPPATPPPPVTPPPETPPPAVTPPPVPPPEPPKSEPPPKVAEPPPVDPTPAPVAVANPVFADPTPVPPPAPPPPAPVPQPVVAAPGPPRTVKAQFYQKHEITYPFEARKRRVQGVVILEVVFGTDGRPVTVEVFQSSGQAILDRAAKAHFIENGYAPPGEAGRVRVEVEFRLVPK